MSNKFVKGYVVKVNMVFKCFICEFKNVEGLEVGVEIIVEIFAVGDVVDVIGIFKGKGF